MANHNFKVGDVVRYKTGNVPMTVNFVSGDLIAVVFIDSKGIQTTGSINAICLTHWETPLVDFKPAPIVFPINVTVSLNFGFGKNINFAKQYELSFAPFYGLGILDKNNIYEFLVKNVDNEEFTRYCQINYIHSKNLFDIFIQEIFKINVKIDSQKRIYLENGWTEIF